MITVEFLGPIARPSMSVDVASLRDLRDILASDESLSQWLENCAVAVDDEIVSDIDIALKDGAKVSLLPPVCGG